MSIEVSSVTSAETTSSSSTSSITDQAILAKDDFLSLLITQLQYQDPMDPMDNQDFASQLAQFSTVEQLENIDSNLKNGVELDLILTQAISNTLATSFVGKEAKGFGDYVLVNDSGTADLSFKLSEFATDCVVTIKDSAGNTVRTLSMENMTAGEHTIEWDMKNTAGETMLDDEFQFSVTAKNSLGEEITSEEMMVGYITGVRYVNGSAMMMIADREISFSMVYEIGEAGDE